MNRLTLIILLCIGINAAHATVKPRDGRYEPLVFADQQEEAQHQADHAPRKIGSQKNAPLKALGSPKVPVILVQFNDKKFTSGLTDSEGNPYDCDSEEDEAAVNAFYHKFCNGLGDGSYYTGAGSHGAITEYFRDQSNGLFTPEFVVIGPVTLDDSYSFYGRNGSNGKDANLSLFYTDAIKAAQAVFSDWSQFDNDGNNSVDMAFFVYAGEGENGSKDEDTIWPQERSSGGTISGTRYGCYACCNEIYNGKTDGIGVFVHELSHALGLPDFYDTNYKAYGMDYWDVMDSGCYCNSGYCPCNYTAYEREFMGWTTLTTLSPYTPQKLTLQPSSGLYLTPDTPWEAYKIVNPENSNEYYVLENRQSQGWDLYVGRGDATNKMNGMLILHVDYLSSRWTNNTVNTKADHQYMTIMPADGVLDSYMFVKTKEDYVNFMYSAYGDLYPGYKNVTSFEGPDQFVWTETGDFPNEMNQPLYNIRQRKDGTVTLHYMKRFKEDQTLSLTELADMTYGDGPLTLPEQTEEGNTLTWSSSDTGVATVDGNTLTITGAGTVTLTASQEGDKNFEAFSQDLDLTVVKAPLLITADDQTRAQGQPNPEPTLSFSGFVNGDDESALTTLPAASCEADEDSPAGTYAITLEGGEAANYELTLADGILTVTEPPHQTGDVNEDGYIDISDIVAIINHIAGTATFRFADVNGDQIVDISDIVAVINIIAAQ